MSGTSYDAIDVVAADLELRDDAVVLHPLGARERVVRRRGARADRGGAAAGPDVVRAGVPARHRARARLRDAAALGVRELGDGRADLVVSHGQTMYHWVDDDGRARGTLQLGQPAWIAERTGLPVVSDLRSRDVARGGNGAPLVSIFDVLLLGAGTGRPAALNLGGIANLTVVGGSAAPAGLRRRTRQRAGRRRDDRAAAASRYDADGRRACRGTVHEGLLEALLDEPYYAQPAPKSTGKELFHWDHVRERLHAFEPLDVDDVVATLTELSARTVADELARRSRRRGVRLGRRGAQPVADAAARRAGRAGVQRADDRRARAWAPTRRRPTRSRCWAS